MIELIKYGMAEGANPKERVGQRRQDKLAEDRAARLEELSGEEIHRQGILDKALPVYRRIIKLEEDNLTDDPVYQANLEEYQRLRELFVVGAYGAEYQGPDTGDYTDKAGNVMPELLMSDPELEDRVFNGENIKVKYFYNAKGQILPDEALSSPWGDTDQRVRKHVKESIKRGSGADIKYKGRTYRLQDTKFKFRTYLENEYRPDDHGLGTTVDWNDVYRSKDSFLRQSFRSMSESQLYKSFDYLVSAEMAANHERNQKLDKKRAEITADTIQNLGALEMAITSLDDLSLSGISRELANANLSVQSLVNLDQAALRVLPEGMQALVLSKAMGSAADQKEIKEYLSKLAKRLEDMNTDALHWRESRAEAIVSGDLPDKLLNMGQRIVEDPFNPRNLMYLLGASAGAWFLKSTLFKKSPEDGSLATAGKWAGTLAAGFGLYLGIDHFVVKRANPRGKTGVSDALGMSAASLSEGLSSEYLRARYPQLTKHGEAAFQSLKLVSDFQCADILDMMECGITNNKASVRSKLELAAKSRGVDTSAVDWDSVGLLENFKVILETCAARHGINRSSYPTDRAFEEAAMKTFEPYAKNGFTFRGAMYSIFNNISVSEGPMGHNLDGAALSTYAGVYKRFEQSGVTEFTEMDGTGRKHTVRMAARSLDKLVVNGYVWDVQYFPENDSYGLSDPKNPGEGIKYLPATKNETGIDVARENAEALARTSFRKAKELVASEISPEELAAAGFTSVEQLKQHLTIGPSGDLHLEVTNPANAHIEPGASIQRTTIAFHVREDDKLIMKVLGARTGGGEEFFTLNAGTKKEAFSRALEHGLESKVKSNVKKMASDVIGALGFEIEKIETNGKVHIVLPGKEKAWLQFNSGRIVSWSIPKTPDVLRAQADRSREMAELFLRDSAEVEAHRAAFTTALEGHWRTDLFNEPFQFTGNLLESAQRFANGEQSAGYFFNQEGYWKDMFDAAIVLESERLALAYEKAMITSSSEAELKAAMDAARAKVGTDLNNMVRSAQAADVELRAAEAGTSKGEKLAALIDEHGEMALYSVAYEEPVMWALIDQTLDLVEDSSNGFNIVGMDGAGHMTAFKADLVRMAVRYYDRDLMDANNVDPADRAIRAQEILNAIIDAIKAEQHSRGGNINLGPTEIRRFGSIEGQLKRGNLLTGLEWDKAGRPKPGGVGAIDGVPPMDRTKKAEISNAGWGLDPVEWAQEVYHGVEADAPTSLSETQFEDSTARTKWLKESLESASAQLIFERSLEERWAGDASKISQLIEVRKQAVLEHVDKQMSDLNAEEKTGAKYKEAYEGAVRAFEDDMSYISSTQSALAASSQLAEGLTTPFEKAGNKVWKAASKEVAQYYWNRDGKLDAKLQVFLEKIEWGGVEVPAGQEAMVSKYTDYFLYKANYESPASAISFAEYKKQSLGPSAEFKAEMELVIRFAGLKDIIEDSVEMGSEWGSMFREQNYQRLKKIEAVKMSATLKEQHVEKLKGKIELEKTWFTQLHQLGVEPSTEVTIEDGLIDDTEVAFAGPMTEAIDEYNYQNSPEQYKKKVHDVMEGTFRGEILDETSKSILGVFQD